MISLADSIRQARSQAIASAVGAGATLTIYDGTRPGTGAAVTDQSALVTFSLTGATTTAGVLTFDPLGQAMATAAGTASWARIADDAGFLMDLDVTAAGSGGDIELSSVAMLAGALVAVTAAKITEP